MNKTKKIAFLSSALATALILSYVESLIPVILPIPGAKIGLANIVSLIIMELFGFPYAIIILVGRILIASFLFGSLSSLLYSFAGGLLSLLVMYVMRRFIKKASIVFVSIIGAIFHNIGQLFMASFIVRNVNLMIYYFPYLLLLAIPAGLFIGLGAKYLLPYIEKIKNKLKVN